MNPASIFFFKSILSIFMILSALFAAFTMFEVFGRGQKKYDVEKLKRLHRYNGRVYILLWLVIAYFCLDFIVRTKAELSSRVAFHSFFALSIIILLALKLAYVRVYKVFYAHAKTIGPVVALLTFAMVGFSGGYYLLATKFGTEGIYRAAEKAPAEEPAKGIALRTDPESIRRGKELYDSKCYLCHDPLSTKTIVGPGHKGILKNPLLPASKRPATVENIALQIRKPYGSMPSFNYLTDEQISDITAYMNTL